MPPSRRDLMAEAIRQSAEDLDQQRATLEEIKKETSEQSKTLDEIKRLVIKLSSDQGTHRAHTMDSIDRLGTRTLSVEKRLAILERRSNGSAT